MERVKRLNEKAWEYINKWPKEAWTKAHFRENCKTDNIVNNASDYIGKPILTLVEEVKSYVIRKMSHDKMKLDGRVIRVSYPGYGPSGWIQPQFMEFIPTPGFPKK
jgi:hypothetical protein